MCWNSNISKSGQIETSHIYEAPKVPKGVFFICAHKLIILLEQVIIL